MQKIIIQTRKSRTGLKLFSVILAGIILLSSSVTAFAVNKGGYDGDADGDGLYEATVHVYQYSKEVISDVIYTYSGTEKLVCVYDRGMAVGDYFIQPSSGSDSKYYFFTLSSDGSSLVAPLSMISLTTYDQNGNILSQSDYPESSNRYSHFEYYYYGYIKRMYSVSVEGDCAFITYNGNSSALGSNVLVDSYSASDVAYHYLSTGRPLPGCNAYYSEFGTRSVWNSLQDADSDLSFNILSPTLTTEGKFYYLGTAYADTAVASGGIGVSFVWKSSSGGTYTRYYRYMLPLSECKYDLNLADYKTFTTDSGTEYELSQVSFFPLLHASYFSRSKKGNTVTYTAAELEAAGCFEKGGDPLVLSWVPNKGGDIDKEGQFKDPAGVDDDTLTGNYTPNFKGDFMEVEESDNFLVYLLSIANNVFHLPDAIYGYFSEFIINALSGINVIKSFSDNFWDDVTSWFVPRSDLFQEYQDIMKARFPIIEDVQTVMTNFKKTLGDFGKSPPVISLPFSNIGGHYAFAEDLEISFDWFEPYRNDFHLIVSSIMWLLFFVNQFFSVKSLLNATGGMATSYKVFSREAD